MTRMHFEIIASVIRDAKIDSKARHEIVEQFCVSLTAINPRFDKNRFRLAAGTHPLSRKAA